MLRAWHRLIRFGFYLLYNQLAFTYDTVSQFVSLGAWRCWQRAAIPHLEIWPGARVLEIAFGTGNLHVDLQAFGYRAFGIDLSPNMLRITQRKLQRVRGRVRLARAAAQGLPFRDRYFHAVVSTFPADFILAPETLREVNRVLQPAGTFVIVPNAVFTSGGLAAAGLEWLYRVTGQRDAGEPTAGIAAYFEPYGFDVSVVHERCPRSVATVIVARKKV